MSRWFRLHPNMLGDPTIQRLSAAEFGAQFFAAIDGAKNEFSQFLKVDRGRPDTHEWKMIRRAIFARDDFTCQYCGERGGRLECDHVFPVSRGGSDEEDNLATACFSCNRSKRAKTVEEWLQ